MVEKDDHPEIFLTPTSDLAALKREFGIDTLLNYWNKSEELRMSLHLEAQLRIFFKIY